MEQIGEDQGDTDKGDTKQHLKGVQGQQIHIGTHIEKKTAAV